MQVNRVVLSLAAAAVIATAFPQAARAEVDGCLLLLCLAAPKPKETPMCAATIKQYLKDAAKGRPFPSCNGMSRQGTAHAPGNCPAQYTWTEVVHTESSSYEVYHCKWFGVTDAYVNGKVWSRTWWNLAGENVIEYSAEAKAQLGNNIDPAWDIELAAWQKQQDDLAKQEEQQQQQGDINNGA